MGGGTYSAVNLGTRDSIHTQTLGLEHSKISMPSAAKPGLQFIIGTSRALRRTPGSTVSPNFETRTTRNPYASGESNVMMIVVTTDNHGAAHVPSPESMTTTRHMYGLSPEQSLSRQDDSGELSDAV